MCTLQAVTNGNTSGLGLGIQAGGGIMSALANQSYHNSNASYLNSMASITQTMADKAQDSVAYTGGMAASKARNEGKSLAGKQKTVMASKGLASGSYTYQNITDDTIARSEMDALAIQYNADVQQQNIKNQANFQIAGYKSQAETEKTAGKIALVSGLLSTGSQFAQSYSKWADTSQGKTSTAGYGTMNASLGNKNFYTGVKSIDDKNLYKPSYDTNEMPSWKRLSYSGLGGGIW